MQAFVLLTLAATACLLLAEYRGVRAGVWTAKPLAAAGFVGAALAAGALDSSYGRWILAGLVLSALGDVLLIPRRLPSAFRLGLSSFLLAHGAYAGAFLVVGVRPGLLGLALAATLPAALVALRWLRPHVGPSLRAAVPAYVFVITGMVVCAAGTLASPGGAPRLLGALMFYVSDLAVARERFVASTFWNRAWGLPLYFVAQLVLASTVR